MSYKYRNLIQERIGGQPYLNMVVTAQKIGVSTAELKSLMNEELDHVYSIAEGVSKHNANYRYLENNVNEILAKVKAWDEFMKHNLEYGKSYYEITREHIAKEMTILLEKHESGESV